MPNGLQRETFKEAPVEVKLDLLFDLGMATLEKVERLEKRKKLDTTASTMGGVVGGIIAMIGKWAFWK